MARGTVVIDPGHGGSTNVGGSDANHAQSPSGVLEKDMTLMMGLAVRDALLAANVSGHQISVVMTRTADSNLGLAARANVARDNRADLLVSIHYNGFNGKARGVEAFVLPGQQNVNLADDLVFAKRVQQQVFNAIKARDAGTKDRGVKEMRLGVLNDIALGNIGANPRCRSCLVEIEFIDVPAVDRLLNTGANAKTVRSEIAKGMRDAVLASLS